MTEGSGGGIQSAETHLVGRVRICKDFQTSHQARPMNWFASLKPLAVLTSICEAML